MRSKPLRTWLCNLGIRFIAWGERTFGYASEAERIEMNEYRAKLVALRDGK